MKTKMTLIALTLGTSIFAVGAPAAPNEQQGAKEQSVVVNNVDFNTLANDIIAKYRSDKTPVYVGVYDLSAGVRYGKYTGTYPTEQVQNAHDVVSKYLAPFYNNQNTATAPDGVVIIKNSDGSVRGVLVLVNDSGNLDTKGAADFVKSNKQK